MKSENVDCVGILGAGVMGGGIAQNAILSGTKVLVRDINQEAVDRARENIVNGRFGLRVGLERGKHTQEEYDWALGLLNFTTDPADLADCDLIIEAIGGGDTGKLEDKPLKLLSLIHI